MVVMASVDSKRKAAAGQRSKVAKIEKLVSLVVVWRGARHFRTVYTNVRSVVV